VYELLGPNTHTDVVIPYLKDGKNCYIHVAVGMGSDFSTPGLCHINHWGDDAESLDVGAMYLDRDKLIANPERLAAQGIRCKPKIFMKNNETGAIFGLDLLTGHMYFNTRAHDTVGAKFEENESVQKKINYNDTARFEEGLVHAVNLFKLNRDFYKDVIFLMNNRQQYLKEVVLPPASNISHCYELIQEAQNLIKARDDLVGQLSEDFKKSLPISSKATALVLRAQTAVLESSADNAGSLYIQGLNALKQEIADYTAAVADSAH
jgi:hypothetical protein